MLRYSKLVFISIATALLLFACQKSGKPADFDFGKVENNIYTNTYFKFKMNVPAGWNVLPRTDAETHQKMGMEVAAYNNSELKKKNEKNTINTANLLSVFQFPEDSAKKFNSSLILVAEKVSQTLSIKNAEDYLNQSRIVLQQSPITFDHIDDRNGKTMIGGKVFSSMNVVIRGDEQKVFQSYFVCIDKDFALSCVLTYTDSIQKNTLFTSLKSIIFN